MGAIGLGKFNLPNIPTMAAGGRIPGWGGGDRIPILAEAGEAIVDKHNTKKYAWLLHAMGVPGMALGGLVGGNPIGAIGHAISGATHAVVSGAKTVLGLGGTAGKLLAATATGNQTAFVNALLSVAGGSDGAAADLAQMIIGLPISMMKKAVSNLWSKITGAGSGATNYNPSGGVMQWDGLVKRALAMEGLGAYLASQVEYQMMTESGGNPRAINLTDSNAQHGDPSRGLLQTIMGTFLRYHWPGTSMDIYNPLANIAAAINYARQVYGPTLMRGGMGMGSGHGYSLGTIGASPGWAWVGEFGPELVRFLGGETVLDAATSRGRSVSRGYASGTSIPLLMAEIAKAVAQLHLYEYDLSRAKTEVSRARYRADINYENARIRSLNARLAAAEHPPPKPVKVTAAEINAGISLALAYQGSSSMTIARMQALQTQYLKDISKYYTGSALRNRETMVERQTTAMEAAATHLKALQATAAAARAYAASVTSSMSGYAALSSATSVAGAIAGTPTAASLNILGAIRAKLGNLRKFAGLLTRLRKAGASTSVIQQIVAMGPDDGTTYIEALLSGPWGTIAALNQTQVQAGAIAGQVGQAAAAAVYGQAAVSGFKSQEAALTAIMKKLGKELGSEAARWMHVPPGKVPKGYAAGTTWASPGYAWVGEQGPELVQFRGGERITPGSRITQNIYITTQEINPQYHAAQLGWELARRTSLCLQC
jgi:SLT domain-containing protein